MEDAGAAVRAALFVLAAVYVLWVFYLAAMNLRRARQAGRLTGTALAFALPVLLLAVAVDVAVNLTLATVVFFDRPREWTVSDRLSRYLPANDWRANVAMWVACHLLDPFDPSGSHLRR
jgi:hypothetical protein